MLGIISGLCLLLFSFYLLYVGSVMGNTWVKILAVVIGLGSGGLIAVSRLKLNLKRLEAYKEALRNLSKNPKDERLKEIAYDLGVSYYRNKRDDRKLLPLDIEAINRDIDSAIKSKK